MRITRHLFWLVLVLASGALIWACSDDSGQDNGDGTCVSPCPDGTVCQDGNCIADTPDGDIAGQDCTTGEYECEGNSLYFCGSSETWELAQDCTAMGDYVCLYGQCQPRGTTDGDTPDGDSPDGDAPDGDADGDPDGDIDGDLDQDVDFDLGDPDIEHQFELVTCDHNPSLNAPDIKVTPNAVDFGAVPIGSSHEESVLICNAGGQDLAITSVQLGQGTSREFFKFAPELPAIVPPGKAIPLYLLYVPQDNTKDSGTVIVLSSDLDEPSVTITLISDIKPTPVLQVNPQVLQFLGAQNGDTVSKQVEISNIGLAPTSVTELRVFGQNSPYSVTKVEKPGQTISETGPWALAPDELMIVTVTMTMGEQARDDELIIVWLVDTESRESRVQLTTSDMDLCAVPNAGPDQVVRPLDTVVLDGSLSYDPNGVVTEYMWEWLAIPDGATRVVLLDQQGNEIQNLWTTEAHPHFYAELAGTYELRLTVKDEDPECTSVNADTVAVNAVPDETIHIQLIWSDPGNDFDLHLIKPGGTHSRNCGAAENDTDCCWSNCDTDMGREEPCPERGCPGPADSPNWGSADSRDDDPTLDIDDRNGRGPENINLSLPEIGDYKITVENYQGSETALVIVRIYLFGALRTTFYYGPQYTPTGIPKHYHWNVAYLRVNSESDIQIIPITHDIIEVSPVDE